MTKTRTLFAFALVLCLGLGALLGDTVSAFTSATGNPNNTFTAAASFCDAPVTPFMMTGFETGLEGSAGSLPGFFDTFTTDGGTPVVDATVKRTGAYSLKIQAGDVDTSADAIGPASSVLVVRFAVRLAALPAEDVVLFAMDPNVGAEGQLIYQLSSQRFRAQWKSSGGANSSMTVSAGTWYVIDLRLNVGTNPRTIDWQVNGVAQTSATSAEATSSLDTGDFFNLGTTEGDLFTANYDDLIASVTAADYPIGDGRILPLHPDGQGTHSGVGNFRNEEEAAIDATSPGRLDDQPFGTADYVKQTINSATSYLEFTLGDSTESCFNAVTATVGYASQTTSTNNGKASVFDGAAETIVHSGAMNQTTLQKKAVLVSPSGGDWTRAEINALKARVGYSSDVSPNPYWHALVIQVDVNDT